MGTRDLSSERRIKTVMQVRTFTRPLASCPHTGQFGLKFTLYLPRTVL